MTQNTAPSSGINPVRLHRRLTALDERSLDQLYRQVVGLLSGTQGEQLPLLENFRPPTASRVLVLGKTGSGKTSLIREMLGVDSRSEMARLFPSDGGIGATTCSFVLYQHDNAAEMPVIRREMRYRAPDVLDAAQFGRALRQLDPMGCPGRFFVRARFPRGSAGIEWIDTPPVATSLLPELKKLQRIENNSWSPTAAVVVGRRASKAKELKQELATSLTELVESRVVCLSRESEAEVPGSERREHESGGPADEFFGTEGIEQLRDTLSESATGCDSPDSRRDRMCRALVTVALTAERHRLDAAKVLNFRTEIDSFLHDFEREWRVFFRKEQRNALNDLRLKMVAHKLKRHALLFGDCRAAEVQFHLRKSTLPELKDFLQGQLSLLRKALQAKCEVSPAHPSSSDPVAVGIVGELVKTSLLVNAPQLLLALPPLNQLWLVGGLQVPGQFAPLVAPNLDLPRPLDSLESPTNTGLDFFADVANRFSGQIADVSQKATTALETALNIVVLAQIGTVVAGVVQGAMAVASSMALSTTEQLLEEEIRQLEKSFPRIKESILRSTALIRDVDAVRASIEAANETVRLLKKYDDESLHHLAH
jgi:hypothetical protein